MTRDAPGLHHDTADRPARILWHFGFMKVATTSTQLLMRRNMEALSPHVTTFPKHVHTLNLRRAAQGYMLSRDAAARARLEAEIARIVEGILAAGNGIAIVSDEELCAFYQNPGFFADLGHLMHLVETAARPLVSEFVFYTRDMQKWLRSCHNQVVKSGRCVQDFEDWEKTVTFDRDWDAIHACLSSATTAPVTFFSLEEELASGQAPGMTLLRHAAVPEDCIGQLVMPPMRNEGLSPGALDFLLAVNRSALGEPAKRLVRRLVLDTPEAFS